MAPDNEHMEMDGPPPYTMLNILVGPEEIDHVFMYNGARVHVVINAESLEGEGDVSCKFSEFLDGIDDDLDVMEEFQDWVLDALHDWLENVSSTKKKYDDGNNREKSITLLEYFSPPIFAFELVNRDGELTPVELEYNPRLHGDFTPKTAIIDTPLERKSLSVNESSGSGRSTPSSTASSFPSKDNAIHRSTLPQVPLINASKLERVRDIQASEDVSSIPTKVRRRPNGQVFFFKPAFADHGHLRELESLSLINRRGDLFNPPFRTSRLVGLVVWGSGQINQEKGQFLMGFLLEYIEGDRLRWQMRAASLDERKRWFKQIEATLGRLHEVRIVWGDVKQDNVMIDKEGNAVVVDFGGGYRPDYIKSEIQGTTRGDMMGLEHMRGELMGDE